MTALIVSRDSSELVPLGRTRPRIQLRMLSGRARPAARLAAAIGNSAMIIYVYLAHLSSIEWHRFGTFRTVPEGQSTSLRDYIRLWWWVSLYLRICASVRLCVCVFVGAPAREVHEAIAPVPTPTT